MSCPFGYGNEDQEAVGAAASGCPAHGGADGAAADSGRYGHAAYSLSLSLSYYIACHVVVIAVGCQPRAEVLLFVNKRDFAVGVRGVADRDTVDVDRWRQRQLSWIFYVGCSKPHADTL